MCLATLGRAFVSLIFCSRSFKWSTILVCSLIIPRFLWNPMFQWIRITSFPNLLKAISTIFYHHLAVWSFDVDGKTLSKFLFFQDDPCYNIHAIHISILLPDAFTLDRPQASSKSDIGTLYSSPFLLSNLETRFFLGGKAVTIQVLGVENQKFCVVLKI